MKIIEFEELKKMPIAGRYVDWILPWVEESLFSCFQFLALELEPFEKYNSDGGVCLLASGTGTAEGRQITDGSVFGLENTSGIWQTRPEWFRAEQSSIILCLNTNIFDNVCFGMGCGAMHTRMRNLVIDSYYHDRISAAGAGLQR